MPVASVVVEVGEGGNVIGVIIAARYAGAAGGEFNYGNGGHGTKALQFGAEIDFRSKASGAINLKRCPKIRRAGIDDAPPEKNVCLPGELSGERFSTAAKLICVVVPFRIRLPGKNV